MYLSTYWARLYSLLCRLGLSLKFPGCAQSYNRRNRLFTNDASGVSKLAAPITSWLLLASQPSANAAAQFVYASNEVPFTLAMSSETEALASQGTIDRASSRGSVPMGGDLVAASSEAPSQQFGEYFDELFDLDGKSITFIPDGVGNYHYSVDSIASLPTDITLGTVLTYVSNSDDDFEQVTWSGDAVPYFGIHYTSFWVNSNGTLNFVGGSRDNGRTLDVHLSRAQIALLWVDLYPGVAGMIRFYEAADRVVVSFDGVTEYNASNSNTFQAELFFDGRIRLSYVGIQLTDTVVGLSPGRLVYDSTTYVEEDFMIRIPRTLHVSTNGLPIPPFVDWVTAATNIQDAIDEALPGDTVLVADGVYSNGVVVHDALTNNRIALTKPITVRSLNGPSETFVVGQGPNGDSAVRCAYVGINAVLNGFTLINGHTQTNSSEAAYGGGAWCEASAILTNCIISGNSANLGGGGTYGGVLNNCILVGNSADSRGGGAYDGTLNNCTLTGNSAQNGGGIYDGTLNNCTLTGNSASKEGGGASGGTLNNCIVYYNNAESNANYSSSTIEYSCTTPLPVGTGNIADEPLLVGLRHLSATSPCIGAGMNTYATGTDIDSEIWLDPPSIGCDEFVSTTATGSLFVSIQADRTDVVSGFTMNFVGDIQGRPTESVWNFGDGSAVVSNLPYVSHAWDSPGTYQLELRAFNITHPEGSCRDCVGRGSGTACTLCDRRSHECAFSVYFMGDSCLHHPRCD